MSDLLTIGSSGVAAYQRALATVANNIANVSTEGYTRQDVLLASNQPREVGRSSFGTGARFEAVRRQFDDFVESNLRNSNSDLQSQEPLLSYVNRLIDIMGDESIGLTTAMNRFFESGRDLASDPASMVARGIFMRDADGLAARFRQLSTQFELLDRETSQGVETSIGQINSLTSQLALLNKQLVKHSSASDQPSELLDQRDLLLRQLSGLTAIKTRFSASGAVLVSVGDTLSQGVLVDGQRSRAIGVPHTAGEQQRLQFVIDPYGTPESLPNLTSGRVGGLLQFREQVLAPALDGLDNLAQVMVEEINGAHRGGLDADGRLGGDLFTVAAGARGAAAGMRMVVQDGNRIAAAGLFRVTDDPLNIGSAQARVRYAQPAFSGPAITQTLSNGMRPPQHLPRTFSVDAVDRFASIGAIPLGFSQIAIHLDQAQSGQHLHVMTRDGRHLLGSALSADEQSALLKPVNGFETGASYSDSYLNKGGNDAYLGMDLFLGARADVRLLQSFDAATGNAQPPVRASAILTGGVMPAGLTGPIPAGTFTLNGVDLPELSQDGPLTPDDVAAWLQASATETGVTASVIDGRLQLERPADNTDDDIRFGLGPNGTPADLAALGLRTAAHVTGVAADDLLVFVTDRSGLARPVQVFGAWTPPAGSAGDGRAALRQTPLRVEFTSDTGYRIVDTATDTVLAQRAFDPANPQATIDYRGLTLSFSSAPRAGDRFTIDGNGDGIGNNEALLELVELENRRLLPGGLTLTEAYIERVSQVGNVARQAAISQQALTVVHDQAREARDSISGVSLDQEAADLVRFQQAYQANAKVMQTGSLLFDAILQIR